jgi:hypothetical protein
MLKNTVLGLAVVGALSLASALTPAFANYGGCTENPEAKGCPGYVGPESKGAATQPSKPIVHAHNHHHLLPQNG